MSLVNYMYMIGFCYAVKKKKKKPTLNIVASWGATKIKIKRNWKIFFLMHFLGQLAIQVGNGSLKDLQCILPSKVFIWSTGCDTPEIAKIFGDSCSANLHLLSNLSGACCSLILQDIPAGMLQWWLFTFDILTSTKNFSPSPLGRPFGIRRVVSPLLGIVQQVNIATSVPAAFTGGEEMKE